MKRSEFEVYCEVVRESDRHSLQVDRLHNAEIRFRCGCGGFSGMVLIGSLVPAANITIAVSEWRQHVNEAIAERLSQILRPRKKLS